MAFNNLMTQDVCEVFIKDKVSNKSYFFGLTTKNEVTQKIKQESLKAGIGNGTVAVIQSEKEMSFKVTTLFSNDDLIAVQSGSAFADGSVTVQATEAHTLTGGKITLTGTPKTGTTTVLVVDQLGKQLEGALSVKEVTVTGGTDGDTYTVIYPISVTGSILSLDSKAFPKNYYVELHTIGFNVETNEVACDIYWIFEKALPNGSLTKAYEAGKNSGDDIEFTAQLPAGSNEYGKYVVVPRNVA